MLLEHGLALQMQVVVGSVMLGGRFGFGGLLCGLPGLFGGSCGLWVFRWLPSAFNTVCQLLVGCRRKSLESALVGDGLCTATALVYASWCFRNSSLHFPLRGYLIHSFPPPPLSQLRVSLLWGLGYAQT